MKRLRSLQSRVKNLLVRAEHSGSQAESSPPSGPSSSGRVEQQPALRTPVLQHARGHSTRYGPQTQYRLPWKEGVLLLSGGAIGWVASRSSSANFDLSGVDLTAIREYIKGSQSWPFSMGAVPPLGPNFLADAAAKALPAVVNINVNGFEVAGPAGRTCGSGFITDSSGVVLTSAHVALDALERHATAGRPDAAPLSIALQDGRTFEGRVVGVDRCAHRPVGDRVYWRRRLERQGMPYAPPNYDLHYPLNLWRIQARKSAAVCIADGLSHASLRSTSDLALVKIDSDVALPTVRMGSSSGLRAGEWVLALGSPFTLRNSVTAGIVSCVGRKAKELGMPASAADYIQTDAAVNTGNSGGPLVNMAGEVVGVSCMRALHSNGVSFAIPIDAAADVMRQMRGLGRVVRPYIGIQMLQLTAANAAQMQQRDRQFPPLTEGILVPRVHPGSPAAVAGLRQGDIITGFEGSAGEDLSTAALVRALTRSIGRPLQLDVRRGQRELSLRITACEAGD